MLLSLVDTHAHLDMLEGYAEFYISDAAENNVHKIIAHINLWYMCFYINMKDYRLCFN